MKRKSLILGTVGAFMMALASCGGHGSCEAYNKADYTKYQEKQNKMAELNKWMEVRKEAKKK